MDPVKEGGALIPQDVERELVEYLEAWIPFPIDREPLEISRRMRIRWAIQDARRSVRRWIHRRLFPEEARELEMYENEVR